MMRTMMKKKSLSVSFCAALCAWALLTTASAFAAYDSPDEAAGGDYWSGAGRKFGRGLANVAFGWMEIPMGINEVSNKDNPVAASTWGPIYGTGKALRRTAVGVYEAVTFPIPSDPALEPEFVVRTES